MAQSSRELVDLSAESIRSLGFHFEQIGGLISASYIPKRAQDRGVPRRIKDKLGTFRKYQEEVARRQEEVEARLAADFANMTAWRKEAGTEGADLIGEIEAYMEKIRVLRKELKEEKERTAVLRAEIANVTMELEQQKAAWAKLFESFCKVKAKKMAEGFLRAGVSSWLQVAFDDIRFRFRAGMEKERLLVEHHRRSRHNRAQLRLDCTKHERTQRILRATFLALQEEQVENRSERFLEELRVRHSDEKLIYEGQIAQLLGDEEKAKEIVAEQVRRMEECRKKQREAEKQRDEYRVKMRRAIEEKEQALLEKAAAIVEKAAAISAKELAEEGQRLAEEAKVAAEAVAEQRREALHITEKKLLKLHAEMKKKTKKIESLMRLLAEMGAESDSDAPPDERAPPFFTNEDGQRMPRPRTRKERMSMAYREAESARCELRLGMAAMVDKDVSSASALARMKQELLRVQREVAEVREANAQLAEDVEAAEAARRWAAGPDQTQMRDATALLRPASAQASFFAPYPGPPSAPLAASTAMAPPWSPTRPSFVPAPFEDPDSTPRFLLKTASQPIMMPTLGSDTAKITLAPLRSVRQARTDQQEWKAGWH